MSRPARAVARGLGTAALHLLAAVLLALVAPLLPAQEFDEGVRLDGGRFTVVAHPSDALLARTLLEEAQRRDSFPGLPRPQRHVLIAVAPDARRFREWIGPRAPEWGAAVAFPAEHRIVMQGRAASSRAGDPRVVLRHELAHLALHEALGTLPPRWFDEGYASYAAGEWGREELLATNAALLFRRMPSLDTLDWWFGGGGREAAGAYALSYRAVAELAALDPERGLTLFFRYWQESGRLDRAVRSAYGITLDGFEERWQSRTRRRYGVLAIAGDLTAAMLVTLVLILPFYMVRRSRNRERLAALRRADEVEDRRTREDPLAELLGPPEPPAWTLADGPERPRPPDASAP